MKHFRAETIANYTKLFLHHNVRWLSKARVMQSFWPIKKDLLVFLVSQQNVKANAFSAFNEIINRHCGILADIMSHLNELIVELQEEKPTIFYFITPVRDYHGIQSEHNHFPKLLEQNTDMLFCSKVKKKNQICSAYGKVDDQLSGMIWPLFKTSYWCFFEALFSYTITEFSTEAKTHANRWTRLKFNWR